jgi:hypothetical protein
MAFPDPQLGLVISYSYLWYYEHNAGRDEGAKDRPCVIVLAVQRPSRDVVTVRVAPVTHSPPADPRTAFELPTALKQHLGLDADRSWVMVGSVPPVLPRWSALSLDNGLQTHRRKDEGVLLFRETVRRLLLPKHSLV